MRTLYIGIAFALLSCLASCVKKDDAPSVAARYVPERMDDFVFENNLIAGRIYGKALEGETLSPGIDVWVKMPGRLVADEWYANAMRDGSYYHHNHGGKDCYKVGKSLGGGASVPFVDGQLCFPTTNYRSYEITKQDKDMVEFTLSYPQWEIGDIKVSLDKRISVKPDSYFCKVEDVYHFTGADSLDVAAGVFRHPSQQTIVEERNDKNLVAIWEHASDQSLEQEDGMIGVAVNMPQSREALVTEDETHSLCVGKVANGDTLTYYFGSCWSAADIKTAEEWFDIASGL